MCPCVMKDKRLAGDDSEKFHLAVDLVRCLPQKGPFKPSYSDSAKVYGLFKQAQFGPCTDPKPWTWDVIKRAKWEAWTALGNMSREDAMGKYVVEIKNMITAVQQSDKMDEILESKFDDVAPTMIAFCKAVDIPLTTQMENYSEKHGTQEQPITVTIKESTKTNGFHILSDEVEAVDSHANDNTITIISEDTSNGLPAVSMDKMSSNDNGINEHSDDQINANTTISVDISSLKSGDAESSGDEDYCDSVDPDHATIVTVGDTASESQVIENLKAPPMFDGETPSGQCEGSGHPVASSTEETTALIHSGNENKADRRSLNHGKNHRSNHHRKIRLFRNGSSHKIKTSKRRDESGGARPRMTHPESSNHSSEHHSNVNGIVNHGAVHFSQQQHDMENGGSGSGGGSGSDDDTLSSSLLSTDSDNIGLKIMQTLNHMEHDLQLVLHRLNSIEDQLKVMAQANQPFWKQYLPSRNTFLWFIWPVVVNVIFILWRRRQMNCSKSKR